MGIMNGISVKNELKIENLIYQVRGKEVMLDSDLAKLYQCKNGTKEINQAVKNNIEKFPERYSWVLTQDEWIFLRSKYLTLENGIPGKGHYRKYLPRVFTEQGVAMLATVLKSKVAAEISIRIMDAFVAMKKYISNNLIEQKYINNLVLEDHNRIKSLEMSFEKFEEKRKSSEIYFNGQIYDAYSKIIEIFKEARDELIIIDSYVDNTLLDIIKRLKIKITIITKENNLLTKQDIEKYNKQYHNLNVVYDNTYHDRYFILDKGVIYHCGASINRIGYKTFSITLLSDKEICKLLINNVEKLV